jgi:asparagine synthase (glutamine-hydrolysing)
MRKQRANLRDLLQELRELGWNGSIYRARREARIRLGIDALVDRGEPDAEALLGAARFHDDVVMSDWVTRLPFAAPHDVAELRSRIPDERLRLLGQLALSATRGKILCFSRWSADFGYPIDWHMNPVTGRRWNQSLHWSASLKDQASVGDVKVTWEVGRFPQAYAFARAATFEVAPTDVLAEALEQQVRSFVSNNPFAHGVHWNSGQEVALRLMSFVFSVGAFTRLGIALNEDALRALAALVTRGAFAIGQHLENQLEFARRAIYNNHLLSEAVGLVLAAWLLPRCDAARRWARIGKEILDEQSAKQVYKDGAYIQHSHNYHRVAMQDYLWACRILTAARETVPEGWRCAMERSLDFLLSHQNTADGRLPNYGFNDGALPCPLSTCDFSDFRPILQTLSVISRGERIYEPGPWDEEAAWFLGRGAVDDAPVRPTTRHSVAFRETGYYVLRGRDPRSFATFRCGSIQDRFSQIDMLHLDVWWRGHNVLVDPGSYVYNGSESWHSHFSTTASHNTVQVDGLDQMLPFRQFKCLYWTQARLLAFEDRDVSAFCAGEHYGFRRHPGACTHRRAILFGKDDLWIVVDWIFGAGRHRTRLHWLGGPYPFDDAAGAGRLTLITPDGPFTVTVLDERGAALEGEIVCGRESPPRGWLSRYYGERLPVPSLAVERSGVPGVTISVLCAGTPEVDVRGSRWSVRAAGSTCTFSFDESTIVPHDVDAR